MMGLVGSGRIGVIGGKAGLRRRPRILPPSRR